MKRPAFALAVIGLGGCTAAIDGERYLETGPKMDLTSFFDGSVKAWGMVQNRSGDVVQRFVVDIRGEVNDEGQVVLNESFYYVVGEGAPERVWTLTPTGPANYEGQAPDVLGSASGRLWGNALNLKYEMVLPVGSSSYRVTFDDWMWAFDADTVINRSYIRKFGFVVAEVTMFMQKQDSRGTDEPDG
jgi:hypothetical protein